MIARKALARSRSYAQFFRAFLGAHRTIGAVAPTSRAVAQRIARLAGIEHAATVAELGPGTGAITHELLAALPAHGRLWAFEVHPPFLAHLQATVDDPRFTLLAQSAATVDAVRPAVEDGAGFDAIVSSVPFSLMGPEQTASILAATARALRPNGMFVALQYHPRYLAPFMRQAFTTVERSVYPWNIPPVLLLRARGPRSSE